MKQDIENPELQTCIYLFYLHLSLMKSLLFQLVYL